jgi:hypothetical protein
MPGGRNSYFEVSGAALDLEPEKVGNIFVVSLVG